MSKFDRNRIKDGWEKLCTTKKQTNRHYENNGYLAVNQKVTFSQLPTTYCFYCQPCTCNTLRL